MCFRKWFNKPDPLPDEQPYTGRTALLFAINDYPGKLNDLRGCLNDQENIEKNLFGRYYPDFQLYKYSDSQVTSYRFLLELKKFIKLLRFGDVLFISYSGHGTQGVDPYHTEADGYSEALYLYDGCLWDYDLASILRLIPEGARVILSFDSCFSAGAVRGRNYLKPRFVQTHDVTGIKRRASFLRDVSDRFILFAGCQEYQTAADAHIDGQYCGAFTHYWVDCFEPDMTYREWIDETIYDIRKFEQVPVLTGNNLDNKVFT